MEPRTPTFVWIPFVFSVSAISWVLLVGALGVLSAVVIAPALRDVNTAAKMRNDYQATLQLLDQKIAMEKKFIQAATTEPVLMERLASRQLNFQKPGEETLILDPKAADKDRSVETLLAESLKPVAPAAVAPMPVLLEATLHRSVRVPLIVFSCGALVLSFLLGVKYERGGIR